jgi:hypothetical protein
VWARPPRPGSLCCGPCVTSLLRRRTPLSSTARGEHLAAIERQEELERKIRGNGGGIPPATLAEATEEVDAAARRLAKLVDEINEHGATVKDIDSGLIDFPALRHGETVLLCWRLGEDEIRFWHGTADGFAGRRPLPFEDEEA